MSVIDGTKKFQCRHEFLANESQLVCWQCGHRRLIRQLPTTQPSHRLLFFPIPQFPAVKIQVPTAAELAVNNGQ